MAISTIKIHRALDIELSVVVADTLEAAVARNEKIGQKAIKAGHSVTWGDGRKQWIATEADFENSDHIWAEDGNRVRCTRKLITMNDGTRREEILRTVWKDYFKIYGE